MVLVCMALLGWQFCYPAAVQFAASNPTVDVVSLGVKDPAGPDSKWPIHLEQDQASLIGIEIHTPTSTHTPLFHVPGGDDRVSTALLPVTGRQPSAP